MGEADRGGGLFSRKAMGRSRKPLAEVYSQERPVARHFVCPVYSTHFAIFNTLKIQGRRNPAVVGISEGQERITSGRNAQRKGRIPVENKNFFPASAPWGACFDQNRIFRYNHDHYAPLAQLDRASGYEPEGREFESLRARQKSSINMQLRRWSGP